MDRRIPPTARQGWTLAAGRACDALGRVTGRRFAISAQRVREFCSASPVDASRIRATGFAPPVPALEALARTVRHEFPDGE